MPQTDTSLQDMFENNKEFNIVPLRDVDKAFIEDMKKTKDTGKQLIHFPRDINLSSMKTLKEQVLGCRPGTRDYWELRALLLEKAIDPAYSDQQRENYMQLWYEIRHIGRSIPQKI